MLVVDVNKRITIPEIRKLDWFNHDLPDYLKQQSQPANPSPEEPRKGSVTEPADHTPSPHQDVEDTRSIDSNEIHIPGLGIIDPRVINDLCNLIGDGITADDLYNILVNDLDKNIKISYQLARDYRRMKEGTTHIDEGPAEISLGRSGSLKNRSLSASTGPHNQTPTNTEITLNHPLDEPEVVVPSFIRVLPHTLPLGERSTEQAGGLNRLKQSLLNSQASPLRTTNKPLTPAEPSKGEDKRLGAHSVTQLAGTRPRKSPRTKWHFGIRSKSPPMTVMLEIYRTLQTLGFEFKRKELEPWTADVEGEGDRKGSENEKRRRRRKAEEEKVKRAQNLYFIETRCRLDDVMVSPPRLHVFF